jgi:hypothetical protein
VSDQGETQKAEAARAWPFIARAVGVGQGGPRTGKVPISDLARPDGSPRVGSITVSLVAARTVRSRLWGPYDFVAPAACQEASEQRLQGNVKAVTFPPTHFMGVTGVLRSNKWPERIGEVTATARGGAA